MSRTTVLATALVSTFVFALSVCVESKMNAPAPKPIVSSEVKSIDQANSSEIDKIAATGFFEQFLASLEPRYTFAPVEDATTQSLAGHYYQGDGKGLNIRLELNQNGEYEASWHGCLGLYGTAKGTWKISESKAWLTPTEETDMLKEHLRELFILSGKTRPILVRPEDLRFLNHFGEDRSSCLRLTGPDQGAE